jgi:hypothetical protein
MGSFSEYYDLGAKFDFASIEYENACSSDVVKALLGPMTGDLTAIAFLSAPYAGVLRFAEGIDSLRNLGLTGINHTTEHQRATAVICGVAQLGGVIWMAIVLIFTGAFCVCAPLASLCCLRVYRTCRQRETRRKDRNKAIDRLLAKNLMTRGSGGPDSDSDGEGKEKRRLVSYNS